MILPDYRVEPPKMRPYLCCPWCGSEMYDYVIEDKFGEIVGCSQCVRLLDADEYLEKKEGDDQ